MIGIENLEKVAKSVGKIGTQVGSALEDGKVNMEDIDEGMAIIMEFPNLSSVKYSQLDDEVKDIDDAEKARLAQVFSESFNLPNDNIEETIEEGLVIILGVVRFVMRFMKKPAPEAPAA